MVPDFVNKFTAGKKEEKSPVADAIQDAVDVMAHHGCKGNPLKVCNRHTRNLPYLLFIFRIFCEGAFMYVLMGVAFYYTKEDKKKLSIAYLVRPFPHCRNTGA